MQAKFRDTTLEAIAELEAIGRAAWPPGEIVDLDGWLLCHGDGYTRRTNSVHPVCDGGRPLAQRIERAEEWFRGRHLRPVFKLTKASQPSELDGVLEARGYSRDDPTQTMELDLRSLTTTEGADAVTIEGAPSDAWVETRARWMGASRERTRAMKDTYVRIGTAGGFASLRDTSGDVVAQALGVLEGDRVQLVEIHCAANARRSGHAECVIGGVLEWAVDRGARIGMLSVEEGNTPARRLYAKLGFADVYGYWYRSAPE